MALRGRPELTDEMLMVRFQRGEVAAFAELVQRHKTRLFNFALRHVQSRSTAEDILQDVLLRVVHKAQDFKHEARFTTWVYAILRNSCVEALRKSAALSHAPIDHLRGPPPAEDLHLPPVPPVEETSESFPAASDIRQILVHTVEGLPDEQREVFLLREIADLPFKDIAEITGVPENVVKSRMRHALERLQETLSERQDEPRIDA